MNSDSISILVGAVIPLIIWRLTATIWVVPHS